jgi:hypothetical protein
MVDNYGEWEGEYAHPGAKSYNAWEKEYPQSKIKPVRAPKTQEQQQSRLREARDTQEKIAARQYEEEYTKVAREEARKLNAAQAREDAQKAYAPKKTPIRNFVKKFVQQQSVQNQQLVQQQNTEPSWLGDHYFLQSRTRPTNNCWMGEHGFLQPEEYKDDSVAYDFLGNTGRQFAFQSQVKMVSRKPDSPRSALKWRGWGAQSGNFVEWGL